MDIKKNRIILIIGWTIFIIGAALFFILFVFNKEDDSEESDTKFTYKTNANLDINALIGDYYFGIVTCDQELLKSLVKDKTAFDNMDIYEQQSKIITAYSNINCYSVDGYNDEEFIVYVTCELSIAGINSTPMDIETFYIVKNETGGYIIDNTEHNTEIKNYMNKVQSSEDIQEIYQSVKNNIEQCKQTDPDLEKLWQKLYEN